MIGAAIDDAIKRLLTIAIIVGFLIAAFAFSAVPWIWQYLKPIIHSLTA